MQPEQIKTILDMMAKHGIIRITYDPLQGRESEVEIWQRTGPGMGGRVMYESPLTREEKEYYTREYDKCFGTTPRTDD